MSDASDLFGLSLLQTANLSTRLEYVHRNLEAMLRSQPDYDRMHRALERLQLAMPSFIADAKDLEMIWPA